MDLKQSRLFTKKEFIFKENGLQVKVRDLTSYQEVEIPFEEINSKKIIRQSKTDNTIIALALLFGISFLANLTLKIIGSIESKWESVFLMFLLTALSVLLAYVNSKKQILVPTANNGFLEIFDGRPTKQMTEDFIVNLTMKSNDYLKRKYGSIDHDLPIEPQLMNLIWLKEQEILKDEEFEELKSELIGKQGNNNPIGFE